MTQFASTLYPQTNPTNPVLVDLREAFEHSGHSRSWLVNEYLDYLAGHCPSWPAVHQEHAIRVLTRLANFTG